MKKRTARALLRGIILELEGVDDVLRDIDAVAGLFKPPAKPLRVRMRVVVRPNRPAKPKQLPAKGAR